MAEKSPSPTELSLDPGAPRRKPSSGCKCLLWICLFLGVSVFGAIAYTVCSQIMKGVSNIRSPHKSLYHNKTSKDSSSVVQPLIDGQQTFDIAVTVWIRGTEKEEEEYQRSIGEEAESDSYKDGGISHGDWISSTEESLKNDSLLETPIYSDIAFRGLHLADKGVTTNISFRFPTARLYVCYSSNHFTHSP